MLNKRSQTKNTNKKSYDSIIKVQKQAKVIYSGGSLGSFHLGGGQVATARSREQTCQMLIVSCLGLLAGYMGVFTLWKCTKQYLNDWYLLLYKCSTPTKLTPHQPRAAEDRDSFLISSPLATSLDLEPWQSWTHHTSAFMCIKSYLSCTDQHPPVGSVWVPKLDHNSQGHPCTSVRVEVSWSVLTPRQIQRWMLMQLSHRDMAQVTVPLAVQVARTALVLL